MAFLEGRLDGRSVRYFLAGDVLAVLAFVVAGEIQHNVDPVRYPMQVVDTAVPFLVGWVVAATLVGAYAAAARQSVRRATLTALLGWVLADALGQALRATSLFGGDADPIFFVVALLAPLPLMLGWRAIAVLLTQ